MVSINNNFLRVQTTGFEQAISTKFRLKTMDIDVEQTLAICQLATWVGPTLISCRYITITIIDIINRCASVTALELTQPDRVDEDGYRMEHIDETARDPLPPDMYRKMRTLNALTYEVTNTSTFWHTLPHLSVSRLTLTADQATDIRSLADVAIISESILEVMVTSDNLCFIQIMLNTLSMERLPALRKLVVPNTSDWRHMEPAVSVMLDKPLELVFVDDLVRGGL